MVGKLFEEFELFEGFELFERFEGADPGKDARAVKNAHLRYFHLKNAHILCQK